jgi:hypothetical protein
LDNQTIQLSTQADFDDCIAQFRAIRYDQRIFWQVRYFKFGVVLIHHNHGIGSTELCIAIDLLADFIYSQKKAAAMAINQKFKVLRSQRDAPYPPIQL